MEVEDGGGMPADREDHAEESVSLTAIYVDGPLGGTTEEISVALDRSAGRARVNVLGFDLWSEGPGSGPTGEYRPDAMIEDRSVRFFWHPYGPEERARRAQTGHPVWHAYSPEDLAKLKQTTAPMSIPGRWEVFDRAGVPYRVPLGRTDKPVLVTAVFDGGPLDRTTEEFEAHPQPNDEPGIVRLRGFDSWPMEPGAFTPGRYEPAPSFFDGPEVAFIWREYTPEEQARRALELGLEGYGPKRRKRRIPRRIREWTEKTRFGRRRG